MKLLKLLGLVLLCLVALASCAHNVTYNWTYDCVTFGSPASFEYGTTPDRKILLKVGSLAVAGCSTPQSFTASQGVSSVPPSNTVYYVRAVFPNGTFSTPAFYPSIASTSLTVEAE
jgi:outer membrane protein assembly factor BamE (lipoprotein component of BamABCDE complex)